MTTGPNPPPTPLEMLVKLQNQNVEIIKQLRSINGKLGFFVFILIAAIILQFLASIFTL